MRRSLPMARTTTSPEFNPTRIRTVTPWFRLMSSAYLFTEPCTARRTCGRADWPHRTRDRRPRAGPRTARRSACPQGSLLGTEDISRCGLRHVGTVEVGQVDRG